MGVRVGDGFGVFVGDFEGLGDALEAGETDGEFEGDGEPLLADGLGEGDTDGEGEALGDGLGESDGEALGDGEGAAVATGVGVGRWTSGA